MKFNKKEIPSADSLVPRRSGKNIIMRGRWSMKTGWKWGEECETRSRINHGGRQERSSEGQENEWKYGAAGVGDGEIFRNSQRSGV